MKPHDSFDDDEAADAPGITYRGKLFERAKDRKHLIRGMLAILVILMGICWLVIDTKEENSAASLNMEHETKRKVPNGLCPQLCQARLKQRVKHHGGDYLQKQDLVQQLAQSKQALVEDLKVKYGSYYDEIMLKDGKWRQGFTGVNENDISGKRFRRKLKMKLLETQVAIHQENAHLEGCNCNNNAETEKKDTRRRRLDPQQIVLPELQQTYSNFVWTTGGHSASAGHGNLYNESYTAQMEAAAQPIFKSVGINFVAKNYAMGGMRSAPEFALCQESIFGSDTNVITWDFGMTDVPKNYKQQLYMSRAGVHPNRPAVIAINIHGFDEPPRVDILRNLEDHGLTTFYFKEDSINSMQEALPDMLGMNQEQINAVPDNVRYFKCKEQIEKSEPGCEDNKYNEALCSNRHHKAAWHPGWKVNALYGNLMTFFLIDHLEAAIQELEEGVDPVAALAELQHEEDTDYDYFSKQSTLPKDVPIQEILEGDVLSAIDPNLLHYGSVVCHTAITPSELRYKGFFTETTEKLGMIDYEQGVSKTQADKEHTDGPMRIVFDENERNPPCPVLTKVDYKDFLYSSEKDEWTHVTVPNESEKKEYWHSNEKPKGLIMVCWLLCDWGQCPPGDIREPGLKDGKLEMKVNGKKVEEAVAAAECAFLKHDSGFFFTPDNDGKFKLDVFVAKSDNPDEKQFTRITSIIVF